MAKKKQKEKEVAYSTFEIYVDGNTLKADNPTEAARKFSNAISRESAIAYLYRNDYDVENNLIETYMIK